jgi:hypothetical protein
VASADEEGAFVVKDLATGTTVMLPPEGGELFATVETIFGIFVAHPELLAQQFAA